MILRSRKRIGALSTLLLLASPALLPPTHPAAATLPNIVLIIADDQRWDTLWAMPTVESELVAKGVTFSNAFVVNSSCCPSRTSILTGEYSHSTKVYTNNDPIYGGFSAFHDSSTIATWLHDSGYETALFGKYLNRYEDPTYTPPGWDDWVAKLGGPYYNYQLTDGSGGTVSYGDQPQDYATDVLASKADEFIRGASPSDPLFVYFAPPAPHWPAEPALRDVGSFSGLAPYRPPSYNEAHVSDKPRFIQELPRLDAAKRAELDQLRILQYETLLSADAAVQKILQALADTGRLDNTMIVYMSDNGLLWGEHRWNALKRVAYEESIRIPMVIRYDPVTAGLARTEPRFALNIDLAPTFAEVAGVQDPGVEGTSLLPLLQGSPAIWRHDFLIEHLGFNDPSSYCAVRGMGSLYVRYADGEEEYYDLGKDPYELNNVADKLKYRLQVNSARAEAVKLCTPVPPYFSWSGAPPPKPRG